MVDTGFDRGPIDETVVVLLECGGSLNMWWSCGRVVGWWWSCGGGNMLELWDCGEVV